ncbi:MAG: ribosome-associated translation inhibitor RaiA [Bacteroidota bacterium]
MTVEIQYQKMPESESLNALLKKRLLKLAKRYQWLIRAQVMFKLSNQKNGENKICEIELSAPGPRLFAKSNMDNFEKAMVDTIEELDRQLQKRKERFERH